MLEKWKKYWKSQGKVREFCQSGKVGTLSSGSIDRRRGRWLGAHLFTTYFFQ